MDMNFDAGTTKTAQSPIGPVALTSKGFVVGAGEVATIQDAAAIVAAMRGAGFEGEITFAVVAESVATQDEARAIKAAVRAIGHSEVNYITAVPEVTTA